MRSVRFTRDAVLLGASAMVGLTACGPADSAPTASTPETSVTSGPAGAAAEDATPGAPPNGSGGGPAVSPQGDDGGPAVSRADGGTGRGGTGGNSAGGTACSTDGSAAIATATRQITPPLPQTNPDVGWRFDGNTNYNTCNDLSYASLTTEGGTASSPWQLLLFHRGEFVGTGITCAVSFQSVTASSPRSVDVTYRYLNDGDANAGPTGRVDVSFRWDGSRVVMDGTLPYEVTFGRC